jgi:hypothetical protein
MFWMPKAWIPNAQDAKSLSVHRPNVLDAKSPGLLEIKCPGCKKSLTTNVEDGKDPRANCSEKLFGCDNAYKFNFLYFSVLDVLKAELG